MHKTHVEKLTQLIKDAFALTVREYNLYDYAFKVIDGDSVGYRKHELKFVFFPNPIQGKRLSEVGQSLGDNLDEVLSTNLYTLDDMTIEFREPFSNDPRIEGSFIVGGLAEYAGRPSDFNHEIEITVRDDKKEKRHGMNASLFQAQVMPRRKNPNASLGAIALAGIAGFVIGKSK